MIEEKLSVKTICQLTGINEHTLRAWERRYSVVKPRRLDNGRRTYAIEDLEKLKIIVLLLRKGFLIGNLAKHSVRELNGLLSEAAQTSDLGDAAALHQSRTDEITARLEDAVSGYELVTINVLLQQAKAELGVREYLFHVVMPLMARVGEYVARDEFSIGQEHALSAVVKYHLLQVFYLLSHSHAILKDGQSPKCFAIATTEGNLHEFGILVAAVLCALHGYPVFYLGPNLPADALAEATVAVQANCVILGLPPISGRSAENSLYIDRLLLCAPKLSELWIGGSPDYQAHGRGQGRLRQLPNLEELDRLLANIKQV